MSWLKRLLSSSSSVSEPDLVIAPSGADVLDLGDRRGELPADALGLSASGGSIEVVGESSHRDGISRVVGRPHREAVRLTVWASLQLEPANPHDPNAVSVRIDGHEVGHLGRTDAAAYQPILMRLAAAGRVAHCRADIRGGWDRSPSDRGDYGITLYAASPEAQAELLDRVLDGRTRQEIAAARPPLTPGRERGPGTVRGRHHSAWHPEVKRLLDVADDAAAERLLLEICDATEDEARAEGFGVAPAGYEQLAVMYRKRKDERAEVAVLERFAAAPHAPGVMPGQLLERLDKLRQRGT